MADQTILTQILEELKALKLQQQALEGKLSSLTSTPSTPTSQPIPIPIPRSSSIESSPATTTRSFESTSLATTLPSSPPSVSTVQRSTSATPSKDKDQAREKTLYPSRVLLTTYPPAPNSLASQSAFPLVWGAPSALERGPVICSRLPSSIKRRNAIGAHSGSYSIYRALAIAMGNLDPSYKPDLRDTEPPAGIDIPPQPSWFVDGGRKIVSFDPWGHVVQKEFKSLMAPKEEDGQDLDIRPSIAVTRAHIKLSELDEAVRRGEIEIDGKIVLKTAPMKTETGEIDTTKDSGVEVAVSKAAVEPVWWLPGVAERFGISETLLRRSLFEDTGGMYPELITRPDIKVFLPPIGNFTVYIFGKVEDVRDESKVLTLRVHDECNGSDVFGSDICTCKPYLVYAIEECIRTAQKGGVGVVVYFRKEGRALGEVTKYLVYNLRKRHGDRADRYFKSTELIAGVKDMRFQALMPDVLHWLGVKKIDNMVSMSDMKYDAIVGSGIPILKRYDIPEHLIPPDSRVEIDAKIAAGYFTSGKKLTEADLVRTVGRTWEESEH
ncbi:gtp cyclohydrolase [Moniliophthora roreri MCA 2997]|nr:gtp cyclohydrolase [Moniliophthora roreri MCA 2997]KAI3607050.1 gtp cyclohydrolase [Moniliophthora roreri]